MGHLVPVFVSAPSRFGEGVLFHPARVHGVGEALNMIPRTVSGYSIGDPCFRFLALVAGQVPARKAVRIKLLLDSGDLLYAQAP